MTDAPRSARDEILEQVQREFSTAMVLADQLQTRAQMLAASLGLVLTLGGVVVAASPHVADAVRRAHGEAFVVVAASSVAISMILCLVIIAPSRLRFSHPEWVREVLADDLAHEAVADAALLLPLRRELDATTIELFERMLRAGRRKGTLLLLATAAVALAVLMLSLTAYWMWRFS